MENEGVFGLKQILLIPLLGNLADQETETRKYVFEVSTAQGRVCFPRKKMGISFLCE